MTQLAQYIPRPRLPTPGLALWLLLLGCYILTMSGHTYTSDEETMLAVAESLLASGSFALEPDFLMNYGATSADGQRYSRYGPGQSIAILPFLAIGQLISLTGPPFATGLIVRLFVLLLPALITATTALILFAWARELSYSPRVALLVGLLYGLTSLAWPYSRTLFAEPTATLLLTLCAYSLRREQPRWWLAAGAAAALAITVKVQVLLALPVLAGYALLVCWRGNVRRSLPPLSRRVGFGLLGVAAPLGLLLLYNIQVLGQAFTTGYGSFNPTGELGTDWRTGLYGLTLSPGKGLLTFSPTILLGLLGLGFRPRQQWRESLLALTMLAVHLAFYSRLNYWHGDGSWGPRYLVFVLPFLYLPAAGLLASMRKLPASGQMALPLRHLTRALLGTLIAISFLIQLLPILVNFNTYLQLSDQTARFFQWPASPLVGHARLWHQRLDEWLLRISPPPGVVVLRDGFSYSEGNRRAGELLPRWTYSDAQFALSPFTTAPLTGQLLIGDHRPWPLPRANFTLLLNNQPLAAVQRTDRTGQNIYWELRFQLTPEQAQPGAVLTLHSDTWNPTRDTQDNPRNEDLGVLLEAAAFVQAGQPLQLRESLPIPRPRSDRRALWLWYYDTPNHHLLDIWWWYVLVAALPSGTVAFLLAVLALPALAAVLLGTYGIIGGMRGVQ